MKSEKLLDSIGNIDDDLIAEAQEIKPHRNWKYRIAAAAAIVILLCSVITPLANHTPILPTDTSPTDSPVHIPGISINDFEQGFVGNPSSVENAATINGSRALGYICVTAKAVETLPDTYHMIGNNQLTFRLVRMEILQTLCGECAVDCFYFILPEPYMTDLTKYDALVLECVMQFGYEQHVLYNDTAKQLQAMDHVILGCFPGMGGSSITAFSDGEFDVSLWTSTDYWTEHTFQFTTAPYGQSLDDYERFVRETYSNPWNGTIQPCIEANSQTVSEALNYVRPFHNGIYIPKLDMYDSFTEYRRYVNGYPTSEAIIIGPNYSYCSKYHFSTDDLNALPNLASGLKTVGEAYDAGKIPPPHLKDWENMHLVEYVIFGWYAKTDSGIYGVIRVSWVFDDTTDSLRIKDYYDDQYFIVEIGSDTCQPIEPDALIRLLGESMDFVLGTNGYSDNGRNPPKYSVLN